MVKDRNIFLNCWQASDLASTLMKTKVNGCEGLDYEKWLLGIEMLDEVDAEFVDSIFVCILQMCVVDVDIMLGLLYFDE